MPEHKSRYKLSMFVYSMQSFIHTMEIYTM